MLFYPFIQILTVGTPLLAQSTLQKALDLHQFHFQLDVWDRTQYVVHNSDLQCNKHLVSYIFLYLSYLHWFTYFKYLSVVRQKGLMSSKKFIRKYLHWVSLTTTKKKKKKRLIARSTGFVSLLL